MDTNKLNKTFLSRTMMLLFVLMTATLAARAQQAYALWCNSDSTLYFIYSS